MQLQSVSCLWGIMTVIITRVYSIKLSLIEYTLLKEKNHQRDVGIDCVSVVASIAPERGQYLKEFPEDLNSPAVSANK